MSVNLNKKTPTTVSLKEMGEGIVDWSEEHPFLTLLAAWLIGVPLTVGAWFAFDAIFSTWNFFSVTSFIFLVAWSLLYVGFIVSATILGFIEGFE